MLTLIQNSIAILSAPSISAQTYCKPIESWWRLHGRSKVNGRHLPQSFCPFLLKAGSLTTLGDPIQGGLDSLPLASPPPSPQSHPSHPVSHTPAVTGMSCPNQLHLDAGALNSSSHICTESTFPIEPSAQSRQRTALASFFFFFIKRELRIHRQ